MLECRYYSNCYFMECDVPDKCDGNGNCESYRHGHEIKTVCQFYSPMPDVKALAGLTDEMQGHADAEDYCGDGRINAGCLWSYADRIREALGVDDEG